MLKETIKEIIELAMNEENYLLRENLMEKVKDIIDILQDTINAPSNWRNIKEELQEEYKDCNDVLYFIEF